MTYIIVIISFFIWLQLHAMPTIGIIPFTGFERDNVLFNEYERDGTTVPFILLKKTLNRLGYAVAVTTLDTDEQYDALIVLNVPSKHILERLRSHKEKKILIIFEPPTVSTIHYNPTIHALFDVIYTMMDDMIGYPYKKLYYPQPSLVMASALLPHEQKKLCTLIAGDKDSSFPLELYSARRATISFFEQCHPDQFDLYGVGWVPEKHPCYKGFIDNKQAILRHYAFCICYENTRDMPGYITEKIFDCFVAGTVPVYWGAPNIADYVPANCYIDRRHFATDEQLYNFLTQMSEQTYAAYQTAIRSFLMSDSAALFSTPFFVHRLLIDIHGHYDETVVFSADEQEIVHRALEYLKGGEKK